MTLRLAIFDCDGVLIDSEVISARVLVDLAAQHGVSFDASYVRMHFQGRSFPFVAQTIRSSFAVTLPPDFEALYRERLLQRFETDLRPTPGVLGILNYLGVEACVATSSSPQRASRSLELVGLNTFFDRVFTASMVERGKPAPDLFLHAAREMGVDPQDCLVIEDSAPGVPAAQAAGMEVAFYAGASHWQGLDAAQMPEFDKLGPLTPFFHWSDLVAVYPGLLKASPAPEQ